MAKERHDYLDRISEDPAVMVGKPVTVERVLAQLAGSMDLEELFAAFPHLTVEDVQACMGYAYQSVVNEREQRIG